LNDTAIGIEVSMRINYWSWSSSRSGSRNASAGGATRVTSSSVTAGLALENLSEQTARLLLATDPAIATSSSTAARIASSNFSAARWTTTQEAVSASASDFSAAARTSTASASYFSAAAWSSGFATAAWSSLSSMLSSQARVHVSSSAVDASRSVGMSCMQLALEAFEAIENWGTANWSRRASVGFNAAARTSYTAIVSCTRIASSDFGSAAWSTLAEQAATSLATADTSTSTGTWIACWSSDLSSAAWAFSAASHFGSAARINNRGVAA